MKVLHINCNYLGTTLHQKMIDTLSNYDIEGQVFVPTYDAKTTKIEPKDYVTVSECFKKWDRLLFDYKQSKIFKSVNSCYDFNTFDVIHAYTLFTDGNCAMKLSKQYNIPYVVAVRNTDVNSFFKKMVHLRSRGIKIMLNAKKIFFLSKAYMDEVFDKYVPLKFKNCLLDKSYIIPNGIDEFWLKNKQLSVRDFSDKKINLIYAGRVDKNKNIPTTLKAVELLNGKGYKAQLTVVGDIADNNEFEKIQNSKYVIYISAKPKEKLTNIYRQNDIFVMPSFTETFGLVYAEAMSQGLPIIYSKGQGFDGQFEDGLVGYSVNSSSAKEIADAVEKIISNYKIISENCTQKCEKFDWEIIAQKYIDIYSTINII